MSTVAPYRPRRLDDVVLAGRPEQVGRVSSVIGLGVEVEGLRAAIGDVLVVGGPSNLRVEVVAVTPTRLRAMPLDSTAGLTVGVEVRTTHGGMRVPTGRALLGRVIDAAGRPIDGRGPLVDDEYSSVDNVSPEPLDRARIDQPLALGVRAMDTLLTIGRGQRMGLFAGSGVGKSSLMSMIARGSDAAVSVIALVGERGREVREFLEDDLGAEGLARSVVVVATADSPALLRLRAAFTATRIAEAFRDRGDDVVLMMDSLTRVAMAQREIGLSVGEPPATRGYPPSTFAVLARLLERAGNGAHGSITGLYTVLVDGDDHNEPIADAARSILDGHVVLDRSLAVSGHYPAIDVLASISRSYSKIVSRDDADAAVALRRVLAARQQARDLIDVGAYQRGANPLVDAALDHENTIQAFLTQRMDAPVPFDDSWGQLRALAALLGTPGGGVA